MERDLGLGVHAASCTLAVISQAGKRLTDFPIETNGHALVKAIRRIPGHKHLVFKAPREFSALRELSRMHITVVHEVVRVQARIKSLYRSRGILVAGLSVYGARHREEWQQRLPASARLRAAPLYAQPGFLVEQKKQIERDRRRGSARSVRPGCFRSS